MILNDLRTLSQSSALIKKQSDVKIRYVHTVKHRPTPQPWYPPPSLSLKQLRSKTSKRRPSNGTPVRARVRARVRGSVLGPLRAFVRRSTVSRSAASPFPATCAVLFFPMPRAPPPQLNSAAPRPRALPVLRNQYQTLISLFGSLAVLPQVCVRNGASKQRARCNARTRAPVAPTPTTHSIQARRFQFIFDLHVANSGFHFEELTMPRDPIPHLCGTNQTASPCSYRRSPF